MITFENCDGTNFDISTLAFGGFSNKENHLYFDRLPN